MEKEFDNSTEIKVLDHGLVRLVDHMGTDLSIIRAARVSYDAAWRAGDNEANDTKLMRRLWSGGKEPLGPSPKHSTPFEAVTLTFEIRAPIFVFRQWHRHRTQSYNELSARYRELPNFFYVPTVDNVGSQSKNNKQGRDTSLTSDTRSAEIEAYTNTCNAAFEQYYSLIQAGWPKELARAVLPVSTYSHMFTTMNLLNFFRFATLRVDPHAQYEIRVYADAMLKLIEPIVPVSCKLFAEGNSHGTVD